MTEKDHVTTSEKNRHAKKKTTCKTFFENPDVKTSEKNDFNIRTNDTRIQTKDYPDVEFREKKTML